MFLRSTPSLALVHFWSLNFWEGRGGDQSKKCKIPFFLPLELWGKPCCPCPRPVRVILGRLVITRPFQRAALQTDRSGRLLHNESSWEPGVASAIEDGRSVFGI